MNHFDELYRDTLTCEVLGYHQGKPHYQPDVLDTVWERWSCCDAAEPLKDPNE